MTPEELGDFLSANDSRELIRVWTQLASADGPEPYSVGAGLGPPSVGGRTAAIHAQWLHRVPHGVPTEVEIAGEKYPVISSKLPAPARPL
jgi:hypothetical protein